LDSSIVGALVPIGGIIMWSGSVATIPSSWALCNGSNGTPNLQDKFLVGAGNGYAVGATGGSANATLPSHNHTIDVFSSTSSTNIDQGAPDANIAFVGSSVPFGQTATVTRTLETTGLRGVSATNANLPPYYALAFIMRTS
jgi:microcystin-dependent protein